MILLLKSVIRALQVYWAGAALIGRPLTPAAVRYTLNRLVPEVHSGRGTRIAQLSTGPEHLSQPGGKLLDVDWAGGVDVHDGAEARGPGRLAP